MSLLTAQITQPLDSVVLKLDVESNRAVHEHPVANAQLIAGPHAHQTFRPHKSVTDVQQPPVASSVFYMRVRRELTLSLLFCLGCCGIAYQFSYLSLNAVLMFFAGELIATCIALRIVKACARCEPSLKNSAINFIDPDRS